MLNHRGQEITVTAKTLRKMIFSGYVSKQKHSLPKLKAHLVEILLSESYIRELGPDISGLTLVDCGCDRCQPDESVGMEMLTPSELREFDRKQWQRNMPFVSRTDSELEAIDGWGWGRSPWAWEPKRGNQLHDRK